VDEAALVGEPHELGRLRGGQRERLLADDVLAGGERGLHLRVVEVIRRRDVDDVHARVRQQRLVALVRGRQAGLRAGALGRRADHAGDVDPEPAQGLDVDDADEPRADDGRPHRPSVPRPRQACPAAAAVTAPCPRGAARGKAPLDRRPVRTCPAAAVASEVQRTIHRARTGALTVRA
jgi:hypothetical protein